MKRFDRALVRLLMYAYPRWLRRERGAEIEQSYADLLREESPRGRGPMSLRLWLARDALVTGLRARTAGQAANDDEWGRGDGMMNQMTKDLALSVRSLVRTPGFTAIAVLTMALGIGLNATVFSVVYSALLQPLPYPDSDRLVQVTNRYLPSGNTGWVSGAEYWEYRAEHDALSEVAAVTSEATNLTGLQTPLRLEGLMVTPGFFETIGAAPALGRGFVEEEGFPGGEAVVVLAHGLWRSAFGSDPQVLGRSVEFGGITRTVVGVMGPEYEPLSRYMFPGRDEQFFIPIVLDPAAFDARSVERHSMLMIGRLANGVVPSEAESLMLDAVRRLEQTYHGLSNAGSRNVAVVPLREAAVGPVRSALLLLFGAAGLVLLVACVNLTSLLLSRADARMQEVAIRAAMGAGGKRLLWHGLSESIVVGLAGGLLGLGLSWFASDSLSALVPTGTPVGSGSGAALPVALFTLALAVLAGAGAGLVPAAANGRGDVFAAIKSGGSDRSPSSGSRLRRSLVVGQVAGAVILVSSAGLLVRSLAELRAVDPGFDAEGLYGIQVNATGATYAGGRRVAELYQAIEQGVAEAPGVEVVAASWQTPLQSAMSDWPVMAQLDGESEWHPADPNLVGPAFFEAYGIEVVEGRVFEASDIDREPGPVVLSRSGARRLFGEESAVGRSVNLTFGDPVWREVIGVVDDIRGRGLDQDPRIQTYMTYGEGPWAGIPSLTLNVRTLAGGESLRRVVTDVVLGVDPDIPVGPVWSMEVAVADSIARERLLSILLGVFAGIALLLGAIGIYGVVSFAVSRRTREIGLRIAIGARPGTMVRRTVAQGLRLGFAGVAIGLAGALGAGRMLESFLFGVAPTDGPTLAGVSVGVLLLTAAASFIPARRAASIDPLEALRE